MVEASSTRQQPGLACEECRKRKARCDRGRPQCGACADAGRDCVIVDKRSQRGPKKGQLKDLRSRIGEYDLSDTATKAARTQNFIANSNKHTHILALLKTTPIDLFTIAALEQRLIDQTNILEPEILQLGYSEVTPEQETPEESGSNGSSEMGIEADPFQILDFASTSGLPELSEFATLSSCFGKGWPCELGSEASRNITPNISLAPVALIEPIQVTTSLVPGLSDEGLGISDLLRAELDLLYFERVHPIVPMIHKRRYFTWAAEGSLSPARSCLQLAMRTMAAAMSSQFRGLGDALCAKTRRMLEMQDSHGEVGLPWATSMRSQRHKIEHERIQAWLLLAHYEFLRKPEQQALLTAGRAFRLLQMSRLFDVDSQDMDSQTASDEGWIETEEKRRTIWIAFILDRLSCMLKDRPWMLHEETICARLPMPEEEFQDGCQVSQMGFLSELGRNNDESMILHPFAEWVVLANFFGRCITHRRLAQSVPLSGSELESKDFWKRHDWLAAATRSRTHAYTMALEARTTPRKCDPMSCYNRILAYSASVCLSHTAESNAWQTLDGQLRTMRHRQVAYEAASEIVSLIRCAPRMFFFKMHPFLPNAIALVASFLNASKTDPGAPDEEADVVQGTPTTMEVTRQWAT
uniref:Zn(2)-C6 fungal-type domain-containing protein n=1 Tax=Bionectria ochroleuca TaxID=29856 RepID=A0A0B7KAU7_BIOOC